MALDIPFDPQNTGCPARYWRITQAHLDHEAGQATLWLHGWRDAAARAAGNRPGTGLHIVLQSADVAIPLHDATTAGLYAALKRRAAREAADTDRSLERPIASLGAAHFAGAVDC